MVKTKPKPQRVTWKTVLKRMTPAQRESYLDSAEAVKVVPAEIRALALRELRQRRRRVEKQAPTTAWFDAVWGDVEPMPPGFVRCNVCGRHTPPQCVGSSGGCDDCRYSAMSPMEMAHLPSSKSQCWLAAVRAVHLRFLLQ